jgi:3-oxoacyl-[acyl-carrier protein] reductase
MNSQVVLIIGASSTIGCELIREIADENTTILAHYFSNKEELSNIQKIIKGEMILLPADLSKEEDLDGLIETISEKHCVPHKIIFLAAPHFVLSRFKNLKWDDFKFQLDIQLRSSVKILNRFLPEMAKKKYGKIVFMLSSSTLGIPPSALTNYVTSKYALLGFMKALSSEYSSKKICVNSISPTMIETKFLSNIPNIMVQLTADKHPLKRNGLPSDVVPVIKFLLSKDSDFITGMNIPVTGGGE